MIHQVEGPRPTPDISTKFTALFEHFVNVRASGDNTLRMERAVYLKKSSWIQKETMAGQENSSIISNIRY